MNGYAESLIKSVKKGIGHAVGQQVLTYSELQTVVFEVANLVNERPVGKHPTDPNDGCYLCPNDLILGRASNRIPAGPFSESSNLRHRHECVQSIINCYWKKWMRDHFPSLMIRPKWHTANRNVKVDDIVLVQDSNAVRGQWIMGKISKVIPSADGHVRKCELLYNIPSSSPFVYTRCKTLERPVHKLVVIAPANE